MPARRTPTGTWGYLAASWCVLFAAAHVYWALGGSLGVAESAGVDLATRRPAIFVLFGLWGVTVLLLVGAALGIGLTVTWTSRPARLVVTGVGSVVGAVLLVRGIGLQVVLLTDTGGVATAVGPIRTMWSLAVWNPWFVLGGALFLLAAVRSRRTFIDSHDMEPDDDGPDDRLPPILRWHSTRPIYRDDLQDKVTVVLRMPIFHERTDRDDDSDSCGAGDYRCMTHDRPWSHGGTHCPAHDHHEIAWFCRQHGFENMDLQPDMREEGFDPPLTERQLAREARGWE